MPKKKEVGISLDPANAAGKSSNVQNAVHKRVNDMQEQQQKATEELRQREAKKKQAEDAEDVARQQLEPKIKAWAEEHGQRKQLRALLGSLHLILWPGAKWKPLNIGDILDDGKVKRAFHKATLVVHPDKTHHLPPDQRFLAKRIFDAICQAKTDFDEGAK
jgi:DnaJ-class molecular chaperone